jgi:hypothetical protein
MGIDRMDSVVIRVARGRDGRWGVSENGFDDPHPLASFEERQEACDYANSLTLTMEGAAVVVLDEGSALPMRGGDATLPFR